MRVAKSGSVPAVERQKSRTVSRYLPFHSLQPAGNCPDVVAAPADIPRLGDQLHLREHGILADRLQERGMRVEVARRASEAGREVEAKAVHVHLLHPVAQRVHHQPQRRGRYRSTRVAAAGVIDVAGAVVLQAVVGGVVDPAEAQRRPLLAALGGVVEHHVEDHLEPGGVQVADHPRETRRPGRRRHPLTSSRCAARSSRSTGSPSSCAARAPRAAHRARTGAPAAAPPRSRRAAAGARRRPDAPARRRCRAASRARRGAAW